MEKPKTATEIITIIFGAMQEAREFNAHYRMSIKVDERWNILNLERSSGWQLSNVFYSQTIDRYDPYPHNDKWMKEFTEREDKAIFLIFDHPKLAELGVPSTLEFRIVLRHNHTKFNYFIVPSLQTFVIIFNPMKADEHSTVSLLFGIDLLEDSIALIEAKLGNIPTQRQLVEKYHI